MSVLAPPHRFTPEDLLRMPDDGIERYIIDGKLREYPTESAGLKMTVRNRIHSELTITIGAILRQWVRSRTKPRGKVYGGELGVILNPPDGNSVGVDVVYAASELVEVQNDETTLLAGVPTLMVEILSPSDVQENIEAKIDLYLKSGVPTVWLVHPRWQTVQVFHPGQEPKLFSLSQTLGGDPHLPEFSVPVSEIFE